MLPVLWHRRRWLLLLLFTASGGVVVIVVAAAVTILNTLAFSFLLMVFVAWHFLFLFLFFCAVPCRYRRGEILRQSRLYLERRVCLCV